MNNEIARRTGISVRALYRYFDNKEAVVKALIGRYVGAARNEESDRHPLDRHLAKTRLVH